MIDYSEDLLFGVIGSSRHFILNKSNNISVELILPINLASIEQTSSVFTSNVIFSYH